jgi:hypothetical protein
MRFISTVVAGSLLAATPCLLAGQAAGQPSGAATSQASSEMQALIKALSGHWSLKLKFDPSSAMPSGIEGTGEETWHAGPGGITLTDEEVFTVGPGTSIVVGLFWQDPKTKDFHAMDCSTEISHICDLKGAAEDVVVRWTGSELTVDEKEMSHGTMMTSRVKWSDLTADSFTETGCLAPQGGTFRKVMTIHAVRAAGEPHYP